MERRVFTKKKQKKTKNNNIALNSFDIRGKARRSEPLVYCFCVGKCAIKMYYVYHTV